MTFSIRPVKQSDADSWERLRNLLWDGDDHRSEIAAFFSGEAQEPDEVLLAIDENDEVIAHIELSVRFDIENLVDIKTGYVEGLYVEPRVRSSGIVLKLLRAAETWAREQGCQAFASDRDDRVVLHPRYVGAPPGAATAQTGPARIST